MSNDSPSSLKLDPDIIDAMERGAVVSIAERVQPAPMPLAAEASADPASPSALARLAGAAALLKVDAQTGQLKQAIQALDREDLQRAGQLAIDVLDHDGGNVLAWRILATAREKQGDYENAIKCYDQVFSRAPETSGIENDIGRVAFHTGMNAQAEALFRMHLVRNPGDSDAINNLACAVRDQMRLDEAMDILRFALTEKPEEALLWNNLATVMTAKGDATSAMIFFDEAVRIDNGYAKAIYNRANLKLLTGNIEAAIEDSRQALSIVRNVTDKAMMRLSLALALLAAGDLEEGWEAYEARRDPHFADVTIYPINAALWTPSDDLNGRTLLLIGEQGLGDEVMFASMLPDILQALGPDGKLFLAIEPRLVSLFQRSFPMAIVGTYATGALGHRTIRVAPFTDPEMDKIDFWAPCAAPLRQFRNEIGKFPARRQFLQPDPDRVAHWKTVLAQLNDQPKVGVLWKSLLIDASRSRMFSGFERWSPVLQMPGVTIVNLQYGDCAEELLAAEKAGIQMWTPPGIDLKNDLDDLAALTVALDLVVGPANATTNIAAACGGEVSIVCLPGSWPLLGTAGWPWYPQLRAIMAAGVGRWETAMSALALDIAARFGLQAPTA